MIFRAAGPGSNGYNFQNEYLDWDCVVTLANNATLATGQVLCYDATNVPSTVGADKVVLPTSGNAGRVYGVYQGPAFTNTSGGSVSYPIQARRAGYGLLLSSVTASGTGSTAITVGAFMIIGANGTTIPNAYAGSAAAGVTIGQAVATGTHTAYGATIQAGAGAATPVINALITCI